MEIRRLGDYGSLSSGLPVVLQFCSRVSDQAEICSRVSAKLYLLLKKQAEVGLTFAIFAKQAGSGGEMCGKNVSFGAFFHITRFFSKLVEWKAPIEGFQKLLWAIFCPNFGVLGG